MLCGIERWTQRPRFMAPQGPALGRVDGSGRPEEVDCWLSDLNPMAITETLGHVLQGPALGGVDGSGRPEEVDCGAMCMPGLAEKVQQLVDDAVAKGAKVGGRALPGICRLPPYLVHFPSQATPISPL